MANIFLFHKHKNAWKHLDKTYKKAKRIFKDKDMKIKIKKTKLNLYMNMKTQEYK